MFNNDEFQFHLEHGIREEHAPLDGNTFTDASLPGPPLMATEEIAPSSPTSISSFPPVPSPPPLVRGGGGTIIGDTLFGNYVPDENDTQEDTTSHVSDLSSFDTAEAAVDRGESIFKKIASLGLQITAFVKSKDKSPLQVVAFIDTIMHHLEISDAAYEFCYAKFKQLMHIGVTPQSLTDAVAADVIKYIKANLNYIVKKRC